jgi:predicted permease
MNELGRNVRFAFRTLSRTPGPIIAAILSLAIGIGANTALFSVVNGLLLKPLPYPDPDRLGLIWLHSPGIGIFQDWPSPGQFLDLEAQSRSFDDMAIMHGSTQTLTGRVESVRVRQLRTTPNLFSMLGATTLLGRLPTADDDLPGKTRVGVLSHGFWQQQFGGDPSIVGRDVTVNGRPITVVGVLRSGFSLASEVVPTVGGVENIDLFLPIQLPADAQQNRYDENYNVLVRLKRDATWAGAKADVNAIAKRIRDADRRHPTFGMDVTPLLDQVVGNVRQAVFVLFGAVALVLLVACANVANLLLARAAAREKELALRTALGAGRGRLVGQLLTESITLSTLGGILGVAVAAATLWAVRTINPGNIPRLDDIALDARVLAFTAAVSMLTGVAFGLVPALRTRGLDVHTSLKAGGRTGQTEGGLSPSRHGLRGLLVVSEIALTLMLLVGAGLLIRSFGALLNVPPGFSPGNVLSMRIMRPATDGRPANTNLPFYARLDGAIRSVPGVKTSGSVTVLPFTPGIGWGGITVEGYVPPPGESELQVDLRWATPDYFTALGVPLKDGRFFMANDTPEDTPVIVIDEKMARRFWPNGSAIGKRVKPGPPGSTAPWRTIVGVVGSVKQYGLEVDGRMVVYFSITQNPITGLYAVARTDSDPAAVSASVVRAIRSMDANVAIYDVATMDERMYGSLARQRFAMVMLTVFAGFALVLAAVGVYSVMSYLVSRGTRDIGIRMALGADRRAVHRMIFGQGLVLTLGGVAAGLVGAFALTRVMRSLLFEVSPSDVMTFVSVPLLLGTVALAASFIPARRATRIEPLVALREE